MEHHRLVEVAMNSNGGGNFLIVECQQLLRGALRLEWQRLETWKRIRQLTRLRLCDFLSVTNFCHCHSDTDSA